MNTQAFFIFKTVVSGLIIATCSWLSGKKPVLAGFIIALPLMSIMSILFSYLEYRDMSKINEFALSIVAAVPLSLAFFIPFILNKWLKLHFSLTYCLAIGCLIAAYSIHRLIFKA